MCGICGLLHHDPSRPIDRPLLERMNLSIRHRGPDSDGFFIAPGIGLAMRRLAIIDLETGDQPISNEDGTLWIVFNGEIYNFPELRRTLAARGHTFRTNTDTEAIVHLYEDYGPACITHLRGMFALALWDARSRQLFLARDRAGKKPLYYTVHAETLYFGSELKCLLTIPGLPREVSLPAIHHYLTLQNVPEPETAFHGIHKLPPAHHLLLDADSWQIDARPYWDLAYEPKLTLPAPELRTRLRETITEAVRIRLISDVPLGAHLSGGIDSSIIVGLMAGQMSQPVETFSIGFRESGFDELPYARQIAGKFATAHHEFILQPDVMDVLPRLVDHFDEPFADPAALPTWYLAQLTRQHVTVALNGDGGDEAFAGYQRYFADPLVDAYRLLPRALRHSLLDPLIRALPVQSDRPMERSAVMALRQLARGAGTSHAASKVRWTTHFDEAEKWALYTPEMAAALDGTPSTAHLLEETFSQALASNRLDRTLYTDFHHYLPGALLPKVDRATMAHSLEARSPFLDHEVLELAARLPPRWKVRGRTTKWILRDLFPELLPPNIERRGKVGFGVPLGMWFAGPLYQPARDLLLAPSARTRPYLRPAAVTRLLEENRLSRADHGKRIWTLLNLELWLRQKVEVR